MREITKRSKLLTLVSLILFVIAFSNGLYVYFITERMKNDAKAVNYAGIVRGSIQRVAKLAMAGRETAATVGDINNLLKDIAVEENALDLYLRNEMFAGLQK